MKTGTLVDATIIASANVNDGRTGSEVLPDDPVEVFADSPNPVESDTEVSSKRLIPCGYGQTARDRSPTATRTQVLLPDVGSYGKQLSILTVWSNECTIK